MLRIVRIAGIIIFAVLVGFSANALFRMYESGRLFDDYNSARKSNITLLVVAVLALGVLSFFEIRRLRISAEKRRYGFRRYTDNEPQNTSPSAASDIYASRHRTDEWKERRATSHRGRSGLQQTAPQLHELWMKILRILFVSLPFVYVAVFAFLFMQKEGVAVAKWIYPSLCATMILITLIAAIGIFTKKTWGLSLGYFLAVLNLVIFPVGTAIGLLLLITLVGSSESFVPTSRKSRGRTRSFV